MVDPIQLMKKYYLNGLNIIDDGTNIRFDETIYPRNIQTNYLKMGKSFPTKEYYTLETLVFFLRNLKMPYSSYVHKASAEKVQIISFPDSKELNDFFNGHVQTLKNIDKDVIVAEPVKYDKEEIKNDNNVLKDNLELTESQDLTKVLTSEELLNIRKKRLAHINLNKHENNMSPNENIQKNKNMKFNENSSLNRNNILQGHNKNFSNIITMLNSLKSNKIGLLNNITFLDNNDDTNDNATSKNNINDSQNITYDRYDQEKFITEKDTAGFKINTLSSFKGLMNENKTYDNTQTQQSDNINSSTHPPMQKRESRTPIIIVSNLTSSLINIYNIKSFIQDFEFKYIDPSTTCLNLSSEQHIFIHRKRDKIINGQVQNLTIPYLCIDNIDKLSGTDWNRVVAVFVSGSSWQFKGWPFLLPNKCPSDIFNRIKAFHIKYSDVSIDPNISKWNITVININRNRRHMDRASVTEFWKVLDDFIFRNKPFLRY